MHDDDLFGFKRCISQVDSTCHKHHHHDKLACIAFGIYIYIYIYMLFWNKNKPVGMKTWLKQERMSANGLAERNDDMMLHIEPLKDISYLFSCAWFTI